MDFYPDGGSVQSGCWYGRDAKPGGKRQDTSWYHRRYFIPFLQVCAATVGPCATTTGASDSPAPSPPRGAPVRRPATRTKWAGRRPPPTWGSSQATSGTSRPASSSMFHVKVGLELLYVLLTYCNAQDIDCHWSYSEHNNKKNWLNYCTGWNASRLLYLYFFIISWLYPIKLIQSSKNDNNNKLWHILNQNKKFIRYNEK